MKTNGQWNTDNVWENTDVAMYMTNGVIVHDTFVALSHKNSGQFFALDARTGKTRLEERAPSGDQRRDRAAPAICCSS